MKINIGMLDDVRRLERYIRPLRRDAERAMLDTDHGPVRDVLQDVFESLDLVCKKLRAIDARVVKEHYERSD